MNIHTVVAPSLKALMYLPGLVMLASCQNPVVFERTFIEYDAHVTMKPITAGGLSADVSGKRCFTSLNQPSKTDHEFVLSDEIPDNLHSNPKNRIILDLYDEFGVRPGQFFDYVLTLRQNGIEVEAFPFRIDNINGKDAIKNYRFTIVTNPDPSKRDSFGGFQKKDRFVGGNYVLSTYNAQGRPIKAELYFPIANNQRVLTVCSLN